MAAAEEAGSPLWRVATIAVVGVVVVVVVVVVVDCGLWIVDCVAVVSCVVSTLIDNRCFGFIRLAPTLTMLSN